MKNFSQLFSTLERSIEPSLHVSAFKDYFKSSSDSDKIWTIAFVMRMRPSRIISLKQLKKWAEEVSEFPSWLLDESYESAGDTIETISAIVPGGISNDTKSLSEWMIQIRKHQDLSTNEIREFITRAWTSLGYEERYLFNKIVTGSLRVKVEENRLIKALSEIINVEESKITIQLSSDWHPTKTSFKELLMDVSWDKISLSPYPFKKIEEKEFTAELLEGKNNDTAEYHWEGLSTQIIKRKNHLSIWTKNEGIITKKVPEFEILVELFEDDFIFEGILVVFRKGVIRPKQEALKRTKTNKVNKKLMTEYPLIFIANDLLEFNGNTLSATTYRQRKANLAKLLNSAPAKCSDIIVLSDFLIWESWEELNKLRMDARSMQASGITFSPNSQNIDSARISDTPIIFWPTDPFRIQTVLLYAQRGQAKQSNQYVEFTFAVRHKDDTFIPVAKISNCLEEDVSLLIEAFIKKHTIEKFGPVRSIKPELVFEISFSNVILSKRHKSGVTLLHPKIIQFKKGADLHQISLLEDVQKLVED